LLSADAGTTNPGTSGVGDGPAAAGAPAGAIAAIAAIVTTAPMRLGLECVRISVLLVVPQRAGLRTHAAGRTMKTGVDSGSTAGALRMQSADSAVRARPGVADHGHC
jgi:hypothetical protein